MSGSTTKEIAIADVNLQITALIEKPFITFDKKTVISHIFDLESIKLYERDHEVKIYDRSFFLSATYFKYLNIYLKTLTNVYLER